MSTQQPNDTIGTFLKFAAICSILSAFTTMTLMGIDVPTPSSIQEQARLHQHTAYLFRTWVYFLHPLLVLVAVIGFFTTQYRKYLGWSVMFLLFFFIWTHTEALQQALALDALNQYWRPAYLSTDDPTTKQAMEFLMLGFPGIYDSHYFLLLFAFGIGSTTMGIVMMRGSGLQRLLGYAFVFFGVLSLVSFINYYLWPNPSGALVQFSYAWIYPWLQPLARIGLGVLLWRHTSQTHR